MVYVNDTKPTLGTVTWASITSTWATVTGSWAAPNGSAVYTNDTKPS